MIERCRLNLEGAKVLGKALRSSTSNSAISSLKSLKMVNLVFLDDDDNNDCARPILEGIAEASCLESIDIRKTSAMNSNSNGNSNSNCNRSVFLCHLFSAIGECVNLKSLRLEDCDIRTEDVPELIKAFRSLSHTLELLDLSRNHIDGTGLNILIRDGLLDDNAGGGHKCLGLLKRLVLSHNPIGDDGAVQLSKFLSSQSPSFPSSSTTAAAATAATITTTTNTSRIESLWLVDCDIWSPGCNALAKDLQRFDTLKELIVDNGEWDNHLTLEAIVESLRMNVILKHLSVISSSHHHDACRCRCCVDYDDDDFLHRGIKPSITSHWIIPRRIMLFCSTCGLP